MNQVLKTVLVMLSFLLLTALVISSNEPIETAWSNENHSAVQATKNLTTMPLTFTENQGQWDSNVQFRAKADGATMWFTTNGAYYQFTRKIEPDDLTNNQPNAGEQLQAGGQLQDVETMMIKASFIGANADPVMRGANLLEYKCNYFIGNDQSKWATNVPNYTAVVYEQIYDGIDLKYYGNGEQMEYDFIVSPGADFSQIKIEYEGAESIAINAAGELVVTTVWGEVTEQKPVIYQLENEERVAVAGEYSLRGKSAFGFEVADYNAAKPLIIDPVLAYSTYLGGGDEDYGADIVVDASGAAYITGRTESVNFPTLDPYEVTFQGGYADAFVTKLSSAGTSLIYSTYLGGTGGDAAYGIAIDASGDLYLTGSTSSTDFPTLNAYQGTNNGTDNFITKLSSAGDSLIYSTYLGGTGFENCHSIAVDNAGAAYITGYTASTDFPMSNAYQATHQGGTYDAFVSKLSSSGATLDYSTYLGGSSDDYGFGIEVDGSGAAYLVGRTNSTNLPVANAYQGTYQGGTDDAFITKLSSAGDSLVYSTYLGGSSNDNAAALAIDATGAVYLTGQTASSNFPVLNAYQATRPGGSLAAFVTKLNSSGDGLIYSTYLGGDTQDWGQGIAVDSSGTAYITGITRSTDFPTVDPYLDTLQSEFYDSFITYLSSLGDSLIFSTYYGGTSNDFARAIAVDESGAVYVTGETSSNDLPTFNAFQGAFQGGIHDAFVVRFSLVAVNVEEFDFDNLPTDHHLSQNYPNPFNPTTTIEFNLPTGSNVSIEIFNLLGQKVNQLVNQEYPAGNYKVSWDGTTSNGTKVSTGIYFYRIQTDNFVESKKMLLVK